MPCYSEMRLESIRSALKSIAQQCLEPAEVVVAVDNNAGLADSLRREHPQVTVVENTGQRGASATRNRGVDAVTAPLVAFLDDDEIADVHWLVELVRPFSDPSVVGTGGKYEPVWAVEKPIWFPDEFAWVVGGAYKGLPQVTAPIRNVWSGNMAVRVQRFLAVSGFREDFGKQGVLSQPEDTDLCIRMAVSSGGHWMYVPSAVIEHVVPRERASLQFFMSRCVAEGAGKAAMRSALAVQGSTDAEIAYARSVLIAVLHRIATPTQRNCVVALVMLAGLACAGFGFVRARVESAFRGKGRVACG